MHISVIIPAFDVADYIRDAIRSVCNQTYTDWSLVIVDDGSSDATADIAESVDDPRIRVIRQPHSGVSSARNQGLAATVSTAVLFLDADDWLAPDALFRLSEALLSSPWSVAACGRYARVGRDGSVRSAAPPPPNGPLVERLLVHNLFVNGGQLLIRREAIRSIGGFEPTLSYGEDWEYWTRVALLGDFVRVTGRSPLLFVRERPGSAYSKMATDPAHYDSCLEMIYRNPAIIYRVGRTRLHLLRQQAEAEKAWAIGRELIRHGRWQDGRRWLGQSLRTAPTLKRLALIGLARLGSGPFRRYQTI